jgi:esterase
MTSLYYDEYGAGSPLVLLHGLFGSSTNWRNVARSLGDHYRVLVPDARNHGRSPHHSDMTYPAMAQDTADWLDMLAIEQPVLVGHSMGGKTAMMLALTAPERVASLVVIDIAPVNYGHSHMGLINAMQELDLTTLRSRGDADQSLAASIPDPALRGFLLQNLVLQDGRLFWRINLSALAAHMDDLIGFPDLAGRSYSGPVMFVAGKRSDYVLPKYEEAIKDYFPTARLEYIEAGHWVHAEQPAILIDLIRDFVEAPRQHVN